MARHLPTVVVVVLIAATAVAFAHTELLKLEPNPISGPRVDKQFSPVCECPKSRARISFRLRRGDRVDLALVDSDGHTVAHVARGRSLPAGRASFSWNGRNDDGGVVPEGSYRPKVDLARHHRTIVLPNPIRIDVTRPRATLVSVAPRTISPDGDGRRDSVTVAYRVDEPANAMLFVDGQRRTRSRFRPLEGSIRWYGRVDGRALPPGRHRLQVIAEDAAGNRSTATPAVALRIRYVDLARTKIFVLRGRRFGVRYTSDAASVAWRLGRKHGVARGGRIVLVAPQRRGRFTLSVTARGHTARAAVFVGRVSRPSARR